MYKLILLLTFTHLSSCQTKDNQIETKTINKYSIYDGIYQSKEGIEFTVSAKDSILIISTDSVNLYTYSDSWADERIQKCNSKSIELIEATIQNDRKKISTLFGDSPIDMDDYVEQYLSMHKDVLLAFPKPVKWKVETTFYVDEISNHGHESNDWRWTTYCSVYWEDGRSQIVRYNWQPKTYFIDEWGLDKPVPFKNKMFFNPRFPFRSRINVYDPKTNTTKLLRDIDKADRESAIPARFVAYDTDINQTVSVRFRILDDGEQYLEIGPIDVSLLVKANKKTTPNNGYK